MIKDLIKVDNLNPLVVEITKSFIVSNNIKCLEYEKYFNIFMCSYTIFNEQLNNLENSNMSIEDIRELGFKATQETN